MGLICTAPEIIGVAGECVQEVPNIPTVKRFFGLPSFFIYILSAISDASIEISHALCIFHSDL
jgi:hypothetical protein